MIDPDDYCELYDMPASMCSHCRGNNKTVEEQAVADTAKLRAKLKTTGRGWFPASYPGVCACGTSFGPGTLIRQPGPPDWAWIAECCSS